MSEAHSTRMTFANTGERPYRSHLRPACLECRRRKSRCITNSNSNVCTQCQARRVDCVFQQSSRSSGPRKAAKHGKVADSHSKGTPRPTSMSQSHEHVEISPHPTRSMQEPCEIQPSLNITIGILDAEDESPHVVGPVMMDSHGELENIVAARWHHQPPLDRPASPSGSLHKRGRPVLFTRIPRRPLGIVQNQSRAAAKCKVIEMIIGPHLQDLVSLFFAKVNPCFPVFDETLFLQRFSDMKDKMSPAVLCNLYAHAMAYWKGCPKLSAVPCPDARFLWLQANDALNSETFLSPGLPSILAMILNIAGRPSTSVFGNGFLLGAAIARANALGLNRDPSDWKISNAERLSRTKIWWLLVIQDRWSSLAYGTPMQINRRQFDVPVPHLADLASPDASQSTLSATTIFVALLTLTEVLGCILEHVYDVVNPSCTDLHTFAATFEPLLNQWEDVQAESVRRIIFRGVDLSDSGAANLRLAYLAVKFILKLFPVSVVARESHENEDAISQSRMQARRVAEEIIHFVQELDEISLYDFWLPMHAYTLSSVTSFLLRDALRSQDPIQTVSWRGAREMIVALRQCHEKYEWDLADNCLNSYGHIIEKLDVRPDGPDMGPFDIDSLPCPAGPGMEAIFLNLDDCVQGDAWTQWYDEPFFESAATL